MNINPKTKRFLLLETLKNNNIIVKNGKLSPHYFKILIKKPELLKMVIEDTAFLKYDAEIKDRLWTILLDLYEQPTCKFCGKATRIRHKGKYKHTFPSFCSNSCIAKYRYRKD